MSDGPVVGANYDPAYYESIADVEERHFWFRGRQKVITAIVRDIVRQFPTGYRVLEIGCGTGHLLGALADASVGRSALGVDVFAEGLQYARRRSGSDLVLADVARLPFSVQFEMVGAFDVIEHIDDDIGLLCRLRDALTPSGTLLVTVPAHRALWSYFDIASRHCRRYAEAELQEKLEAAGYEVSHLTQFMSTIYPLVWLRRRFAGGLWQGSLEEPRTVEALAKQELAIVPVLNEVLTFLLSGEARLIARRWKPPVGTSLLAVARRKSD